MRTSWSPFGRSYVTNYIIVGILFAGVTVVSGGSTVRVSFYEHNAKEGSILRVRRVTECTALPYRWQERISSVDSHGNCALFFENPDCTGRFIKLRPETFTYVPNLKRIRFNDVIAAVKPCRGKKTQLPPGRYAIQNSEDRTYLTARSLVLTGYTAIEAEKWRGNIAQEWDVIRNRDGTYWLVPRVHFSRNPLTYDMRRYGRDRFPEIGMFKEREYWLLKPLKRDTYMIKNDDTRRCLAMEEDGFIEEDFCDKESTSQHWIFRRI